MAEQKLPLTDDLNPQPEHDSVSPLFNKMDALMARHRSPAGQNHEDIPVLTDIAPEAFDIPILTDVINEDLIQKIESIERSLAEAQSAKARRRLEEKLASENELAIPSLMFTPKSAATPKAAEPKPKASAISEPIAELDLELTPPRINTAVRTAPIIDQPVFLDLPLLDLNAIEAAPVIPTGKAAKPSSAASEFNFVADDLIIDFSTPINSSTDISVELDINDFNNDTDNPTIGVETSSVTEVVPLESELDKDVVAESATIKSISAESTEYFAINLDSEPKANQSPATESTPNSIFVEPVTASTLHWDDDEQISISLSSVDDEKHIEITLDELNENEGIEPQALFNNGNYQIPNEINEASHTEVKTEPPAKPEPETHPRLTADAIAELTAVVGAQLAVDIASEVEQLARQHFSKLMAQFYGDTLRELTSEISLELEERLAPRIVELVEQELISKGLIQK